MASVALIANVNSGDGRAEEVGDLLRDAGATVETFELSDRERAVASGPERIVVAGGDGSIACVAAAAATAGIPLGVVATGTANDFAAGIGLPADVGEACSLAANGQLRRPVELAWVGGRAFVNIASVGLAPTAAEHADGLKGRVGALAYPLGALKAGASAQPIRCRVSCDGTPVHEGEAWQVSVASTGAFGGGASLEANASDGKLDLVVIEGSNRLRLAKHAYGLRLGSIEGQRGVVVERCSTVELRLEADECLNVDGELVEASELAEDGVIGFRAEQDAFELIIG